MAFLLRKSANSLLKLRPLLNCSFSSQVVMEDLKENPYFAKYAKKIAVLQKTSPEEFVQRMEEKIKAHQPKEEPCTKRYESLSKPKGALPNDAAHSNKSLSQIFKVDMVQDKNAEEIQVIWSQYHLQKDVIAATVPLETYTKMADRMKLYPVFLFALPRSQGYEFFVSQVFGDEIHITTLLCYQVHKENAPECLTLVHYKELSSKGIILMRGQYDKNIIDGMEAQCIANQFQIYYGQDDPAKLTLLDGFTNHPDSFQHMDLVDQLENIPLKLEK